MTIPCTADGWSLYADPTPPRLISREAVARQSALALQTAILDTVREAFSAARPARLAQAAYQQWEASMKAWLSTNTADGYCWGLFDSEGRRIAHQACSAFLSDT